MRRPRTTVAILVAASAVAVTACGEKGIQLSKSDPNYEGAVIFQQHCSGCHSISAAGTQGSAVDPNSREIVDGPNFDQRVEEKDQVLYAIRNGGFSSGPMPQDIVVGEQAEKVADFVAKFSGDQIPNNVPEPSSPAPAGESDSSSSSPSS